MDKYPSLEKLIKISKSKNPIDDWDFYATVAGLFFLQTNHDSPEIRKLPNELAIENPLMHMALENLTNYINKSKKTWS